LNSRPRFFILDRSPAVGGKYLLSVDDSNHASNVLRLKEGSAVEISDGAGRCFMAEITGIAKKAVEGTDQRAYAAEAEASIGHPPLVQGLLKGRKMDLVIHQAVELGAARIIPLITARSIPILKDHRIRNRTERWQKIARSAAEQSKREIIPRVEMPVSIENLYADYNLKDEIVLVFWEGEKGKSLPLKQGDNSLHTASGVTIIIGPEGGFPAEEIEYLKRHQTIIAGLGPRVLRAETAAVAGLTLVQALVGDLQGERL